MVPWTYMSQPQNGISIGSAILAQLSLPRHTDRQTDTDHATSVVVQAMRLKWKAV